MRTCCMVKSAGPRDWKIILPLFQLAPPLLHAQCTEKCFSVSLHLPEKQPQQWVTAVGSVASVSWTLDSQQDRKRLDPSVQNPSNVVRDFKTCCYEVDFDGNPLIAAMTTDGGRPQRAKTESAKARENNTTTSSSSAPMKQKEEDVLAKLPIRYVNPAENFKFYELPQPLGAKMTFVKKSKINGEEVEFELLEEQ